MWNGSNRFDMARQMPQDTLFHRLRIVLLSSPHEQKAQVDLKGILLLLGQATQAIPRRNSPHRNHPHSGHNACNANYVS